MKTALIALLAMGYGAQGANQETKTYTNVDLGLAFNYPSTWELKQDRNGTRFAIALPDTQAKAQLQIFSLALSNTIDEWNAGQTGAATNAKREVVKQWQEEILGVPLLMSQTKFTEKDVTMLSNSGLMYNKGPRKMSFILTAPEADFPKADTEFRTAMQSLRTNDGRTLRPFDPKAPPDPDDNRPINSKPMIWTVQPKPRPAAVKGDAVVTAPAGGRDYELRFASPWTAEKNENGSWTFKHPQLSSPVTVTVSSAAESDPPGRALFKVSGENLKTFTKVTKRQEKGPFPNKGGADVLWIFRTGKAEAGDFYTLEAAGDMKEAYWILSWTSKDPKTANKDKDLIIGLIDSMNLYAPQQ